jgi:hypothetical protein
VLLKILILLYRKTHQRKDSSCIVSWKDLAQAMALDHNQYQSHQWKDLAQAMALDHNHYQSHQWKDLAQAMALHRQWKDLSPM